MRKCGFCGAQLGIKGIEAAKEHVLRNSWLRNLNIKKSEVILIPLYEAGGIGKARKMAADSLQVGEVCKICNNGWMNSVDSQVDEIIIAMATGAHPQVFDFPAANFAMARWLLKTACAFVLCMEPKRRTILDGVYRRASDPKYLPPGFFAFAFNIPQTMPRVLITGAGIGTLNCWRRLPAEDTTRLRAAKITKFAVRYRQAVFGCALPSGPCVNPIYAGNFFWPIWQQQATYVQLNNDSVDLTLPEGVDFTETNLACHLLDVEM